MIASESSASYSSVSPRQTCELQTESLLLDVRTPAEFEEVRVEGAVLHPVTELRPERVQELSAGKRGVIVICRSGGRAKQAAERLAAFGIPGVAVMSGGMQAWEGEGLPVRRGKKTMSLERQVRIAAGSLVCIGAVLGYLVNPIWILLSAFVGAGLVFAGITDTCGLAMVLARMPWNNRSSC